MAAKYKYTIIIILLILFTSCGIFKKNIKLDDNKKSDNNIKTDKRALIIKDSLNSNYLIFETFSANFSGTYESNDQKLPLKGIIRIKNNEFIWISIRPVLGIEIGRVLLTQDSIKYLDRMKNEYFTENYDYIKKNFGFEMNYQIIESAITNRFFVYPPENNFEYYFLTDNENAKTDTLKASGIFSNQKLNHSVIFSSKNYYITENKLELSDKNIETVFRYTDFKEIYGVKFPHNILLNVFEKEKITLIDLKYSSINISKEFSLNFKIPKNYKRIYFE